MNTLKILAVTALLFAPSAFAAGDAAAGKEKSVTCHACHGEDGKAVDANLYPNLGGQYASYLEKALKDYRDGTRVNPLMSSFATNLTDEDIEDLAAWYSSQGGLDIIPSN